MKRINLFFLSLLACLLVGTNAWGETVYSISVGSNPVSSLTSGKYYVMKTYNQQNAVSNNYLRGDNTDWKLTADATLNYGKVWRAVDAGNGKWYFCSLTTGDTNERWLSLVNSGNGGKINMDGLAKRTAVTVEWTNTTDASIKNDAGYYIDCGSTGAGIVAWNGGASGSRRMKIYEVYAPVEAASSFDASTAAWYTITNGNSKYYLNYVANATSIALNRNTTNYDDKDLFCFVGDPGKGYIIYNKLAGENYRLASNTNTADGNTGGNTYAYLKETSTATASDQTYLWDLVSSTNITNGFYIAQHNGDNSRAYRFNNRGSKLVYWTGADAGSTFLVSRVYSYNVVAKMENGDAFADGGIILGGTNYTNGATFNTATQITDAATLVPIVVSGHQAVSTAISGNTITVTYKEVSKLTYTFHVYGSADGKATYTVDDKTTEYAHGATLDLTDVIVESNIGATTVDNYFYVRKEVVGTDVNIFYAVTTPVEGKAYYLANLKPKDNNVTLRYYTYTSGSATSWSDAIGSSTAFIAKKCKDAQGNDTTVNNQGTAYYMMTPDGKFLTWRGNGDGCNDNKGWAPTYNKTYQQTNNYNDWTHLAFIPHTTAAYNSIEYPNVVSVYGRRKNGTTFSNIVVETAGTFNKADATQFFNDNYSSAFYLIEATDVKTTEVTFEAYDKTTKISVPTAVTATYGGVTVPWACPYFRAESISSGVTASAITGYTIDYDYTSGVKVTYNVAYKDYTVKVVGATDGGFTYKGETYNNTNNALNALATLTKTDLTAIDKTADHKTCDIVISGTTIMVYYYINSTEGLSNSKKYAILPYENNRGTWYYKSDGDAFLYSTDQGGKVTVDFTSTAQQFAFLKSDKGNYYLYSVGGSKFISYDANGDPSESDKTKTARASLTDNPQNKISFVSSTGSYTSYPYVVGLIDGTDTHHIGISNGHTYGIITYYNKTEDGGNCIRIFEVGNMDAAQQSAAEAKIADYEITPTTYTITINGVSTSESLTAIYNSEEITLSTSGEMITYTGSITIKGEFDLTKFRVSQFTDRLATVSVSGTNVTANYTNVPFIMTTINGETTTDAPYYGIRTPLSTDANNQGVRRWYKYVSDKTDDNYEKANRVNVEEMLSDDEFWKFHVIELGNGSQAFSISPKAEPSKVLSYSSTSNMAGTVVAKTQGEDGTRCGWVLDSHTDTNTDVTYYAFKGLNADNTPATAYFNCFGGSNNYLGFWQQGPKDDDGSKLFIEQAQSLDITAANWATGCLSFNAKVASGNATAKYVSINNDKSLTKTDVTNIAAGQGFLLKQNAQDGNACKAYFIATTATLDETTGNQMVGQTTEELATIGNDGNVYYILSYNDDDVLGFYWDYETQNDGASAKCPKYRAVLRSATQGIKGFSLDDDEPTAISDVDANIDATEIYNLAGQKLNKFQKGVNIVNGQKVYVK